MLRYAVALCITVAVVAAAVAALAWAVQPVANANATRAAVLARY